jgi:mRNA-degrading endonuclease RelE of RelBE toxin-antitoxin system
MNVEYSRQFVKAAFLLTGKYKESLRRIVMEVKHSDNLTGIKNCVHMVGFQHAYRIKMGDYRVVLQKKQENLAVFELLVSRGEVYKKEYFKALRKKD